MSNFLKKLDANQVIKSVYDETLNRLRVDAEVSASFSDLEVAINQSEDSVLVYGNDGSTNRVIKTDSSGELQVDVLSSALPTGAATEAKQDVGNTSLANIDATTGAILANQTDGDQKTQIIDGSGNVISSTGNALDVNIASSDITIIADVDLDHTTDSVLVYGNDGSVDRIIKTDTAGELQIDVLSSALPTGAATSALQTTGNTSLISIDGKLNSLGQKAMAASVPVVIASDQSAVPVSQSGAWTVTANAGTNLNTSLLALESGGNLATIKTNTDNLSLAQESTTSGQKGNLILGAVTTAAPTYTTAKSDPLSLTTSGNLRVDGSSVTQPISAVSLPLPSGASTSALQTTGNTSLASIDGKLNSLGQKTSANSVPVVIASDQSTITTTIAAGATTIAKAEDTASANADVGVPAMAIRKATPVNTSDTDGDYEMLQISAGRLWTSSTIDAALPAGANTIGSINNISGTISLPTGASTLAEQQTQTTSLQLIDDVVHSTNAALNKAVAIAGQLDDVATTAATENNVATVRITAQRALHTNLHNNAGTEVGTSTDPLRIDPTGTTTQPISDAGGSLTVDQATASNLNAQVVGNVASAATDSGNPVKVGGIINQSGTLFTDAQRANLQMDSAASIYINNSLRIATYSASSSFTSAATASDVFTITGSATKTIKIRSVTVAGTNTGNTNAIVYILKRSTANSGGTSSTVTATPHDSNNAAATATARSYTVNPTLGTLVGQLDSRIFFLPTAASTNVGTDADFFTNSSAIQPIVLRGTSEVFSINLNSVALLGTTVLYVKVSWTEES